MDVPKLSLQAIETLFDGYRFRSRLEARWAVFFNALRIPYLYEPEGFDLDGLRYLPDFWLPDQSCFFEVKGPFTNNKGPEKARALASMSGYPVFMFGDIPSYDAIDFGYAENGGAAFFPGGKDVGYYWCVAPCCGKIGIQYKGMAGRIKCCPKNRNWRKFYTQDHITLMFAYAAARTCRFDKGGF